ncbi:archaeal proteasome endopeptidase complex subunit beta [Candidatus Bathyarchaeota archaeon]|nr:archaeal proteasome endopeptidase complex subunit beta [Candidatus Bathyarchaeota archaeon]MBS7630731.1 archaeal proteasome endopeptidase complex subunit beta [Candidatus Bathyarchaeota archaeon]
MQNSVEGFKGTTTVGVVCSDGVILGTDTRATMGVYIASKHAKKVYKITDRLAMTVAGGVAAAQKIVDILKANATLFELDNGRPMPVSAAARLIANILFSNREVGAPLPLQALIGGFDDFGPHIFNLDPLGSLTEEKIVSTGSGSPVAYGVLEDQYKEGRKIDEMLPIVVRAIDSAMKRDVASGDSFDIVVITKSGFRELGAEEKRAILSNQS